MGFEIRHKSKSHQPYTFGYTTFQSFVNYIKYLKSDLVFNLQKDYDWKLAVTLVQFQIMYGPCENKKARKIT